MKPLERIININKGKFTKNKRVYQAYLDGKPCILKVYKPDEKIYFDHELGASFLVCFGLISPILKDMTERKPQDRPRLDEVKKFLLGVG